MTGFNQQPGPRIGIITILNEAVAVIQDKLPAEVDLINAWATAQGMPYQIEMPTPDCIYSWMTWPKFFAGYPAIALHPADTRAPKHSIAAPHQDEYTVARSWVCDVLDVGGDWIELTAKLGLWELAIMEILGDTDCLDCGHNVWQGTSWDQPRQTVRDSQDLMQDLPLVFTTDTFEYTNPTTP
jgi:hypothetical protein